MKSERYPETLALPLDHADFARVQVKLIGRTRTIRIGVSRQIKRVYPPHRWLLSLFPHALTLRLVCFTRPNVVTAVVGTNRTFFGRDRCKVNNASSDYPFFA